MGKKAAASYRAIRDLCALQWSRAAFSCASSEIHESWKRRCLQRSDPALQQMPQKLSQVCQEKERKAQKEKKTKFAASRPKCKTEIVVERTREKIQRNSSET